MCKCWVKLSLMLKHALLQKENVSKTVCHYLQIPFKDLQNVVKNYMKIV